MGSLQNDALLNEILNDEKYFIITPSELHEKIGCTYEELNAMIIYFKQKGLIENLTSICNLVIIGEATYKARNLYSRGGFLAIEERLKYREQKILLEIKRLKQPSFEVEKLIVDILTLLITLSTI